MSLTLCLSLSLSLPPSLSHPLSVSVLYSLPVSLALSVSLFVSVSVSISVLCLFLPLSRTHFLCLSRSALRLCFSVCLSVLALGSMRSMRPHMATKFDDAFL